MYSILLWITRRNISTIIHQTCNVSAVLFQFRILLTAWRHWPEIRVCFIPVALLNDLTVKRELIHSFIRALSSLYENQFIHYRYWNIHLSFDKSESNAPWHITIQWALRKIPKFSMVYDGIWYMMFIVRCRCSLQRFENRRCHTDKMEASEQPSLNRRRTEEWPTLLRRLSYVAS